MIGSRVIAGTSWKNFPVPRRGSRSPSQEKFSASSKAANDLSTGRGSPAKGKGPGRPKSARRYFCSCRVKVFMPCSMISKYFSAACVPVVGKFSGCTCSASPSKENLHARAERSAKSSAHLKTFCMCSPFQKKRRAVKLSPLGCAALCFILRLDLSAYSPNDGRDIPPDRKGSLHE